MKQGRRKAHPRVLCGAGHGCELRLRSCMKCTGGLSTWGWNREQLSVAPHQRRAHVGCYLLEPPGWQSTTVESQMAPGRSEENEMQLTQGSARRHLREATTAGKKVGWEDARWEASATLYLQISSCRKGEKAIWGPPSEKEMTENMDFACFPPSRGYRRYK